MVINYIVYSNSLIMKYNGIVFNLDIWLYFYLNE